MGALGTTTKTSVTVRVKNYVKMAVLVTILHVCQNQQPLDTKSELQETHTDRPTRPAPPKQPATIEQLLSRNEQLAAINRPPGRPLSIELPKNYQN